MPTVSSRLRRSSDLEPGIRRVKSGKGFSYRDAAGSAVKDPEVLARIRSLAIPPAYTDVWICADPKGHLQAVGNDARGRKQYRYHPKWTTKRGKAKFAHLLEFAQSLPAIRHRVEDDMGASSLGREKVVATVVHLLEHTLIRVGNTQYAKENHSYGLTTLKDTHVKVKGATIRFAFKGKSGVFHELALRDPEAARIVRTLQHVPGHHLFDYVDDEGAAHPIGSADVNVYLKEISGLDISAKDFRTWAATVEAARLLAQCPTDLSVSACKREVAKVIREVAEMLGNTPAVCRSSYVHPRVLEAYCAGSPASVRGRKKKGLSGEESAVIRFLEKVAIKGKWQQK
ncbi:MAG: hypothetical protein QM758_02600 [Armatimonas sp.]